MKKNKKESKIKQSLILLFLGFMGGMIYYHTLIREDTVCAVEEKVAIKEEVIQEDTKEEIAKEVIEDKCQYDSVTCKIKEIADNYGLDWKLAVAISKHETGVYTSYAFKQLNNVGGMMYWNGKGTSLRSYNSLEDGIDAFVRNLKYNYIDLGLISIAQIQKKYAPLGADNDPNNLNSYWVNGVQKYYNELSAK